MNQRSRLTLYVLAGLYLLYTGVKLLGDVLRGNPGNFVVELIFGILFLVLGAGLAFYSAKEYWMGDYFYKTGENDTYPEEEKEESEAIAEEKPEGTAVEAIETKTEEKES
ncbi:MAG: hypothetical protein MJ097_03040 [Dorea sp.]|nr:hypothetical protein [Dorea sp.]